MVVMVHDYDGGLGVAEILDVLERGGVGGQVDDFVGDAGMVQGQAGELALLAAWLAVDRDVHCSHLTLSLFRDLDRVESLVVVPVCGVLVLRPAGDDAEQLIKESGQMVVGVEGQGDVHVVRGCRSPAFPPADVSEHRQRGCRVGWGGDGEQLAQQLFGVVDPVPLRGFFGGAEEGCGHGLVEAGHVGQDLVAEPDVLQPGEDLGQLLVGGVATVLDEVCPEQVGRGQTLGRVRGHAPQR